jgi:5-methylcytosine-specific restriction endonuclease McrA
MGVFDSLPLSDSDEVRTNHAKTLQKPTRKTAAERIDGHRDSKGWRTAAKTNKHGDPTKAAEKAAARKHEVQVKAETRAKVWARSNGVCEACGDSEQVTATKSHKATHEAHEVVPRSLTRGLPPEFRYSTENTARVCEPCHGKFTRHQLEFRFTSDLKMDGTYQVVSR